MTLIGDSIFNAGTINQSESGASADFTAEVGNHYEIDFAAGSPSDDLDIALPTVSLVQGDTIVFWLETDDETHHVNITGLVHGETLTAESWITLRNAGDYVALRYSDATMGWKVVWQGNNTSLPIVEAKTASFTAALSRELSRIYECDATSGNITATLPPAHTCKNKTLSFVKTDSGANTLTLDGDSSETIEGSTTLVVGNYQYDRITIRSDGSNWKIIESSFLEVIESQTLSFTATAPPAHHSGKLIKCDATAGAIVITLPTAASMKGKTVTAIKTDAGGNAVSFDGDGSETVNGSATHSIGTTQYNVATVKSDGTEWFVVST